MIFVYNLCPASRKCQYLTSGFERCDGAQVRLLLIYIHLGISTTYSPTSPERSPPSWENYLTCEIRSKWDKNGTNYGYLIADWSKVYH